MTWAPKAIRPALFCWSSFARSLADEVAGLIEEAIKRNTVPFETQGKGFVTVRTTTAKRRSASE